MDITVKMPQLGESVTEGTVSVWLKQPGDAVDQYEALLEVITDKVNAEVPSPEAGVVKELLAAEGDTVPVGTAICILEGEGEGAGAAPAEAALAAGPASAAATTPAAEAPAAAPATSAPPAAASAGSAASAPAPSAATSAAPERGRYSPAVRRLARECGVELSRVAGTGAGGRVTRGDVERFVESGGGGQVAAPAASAAPAVHAATTAAGAPTKGPVAQAGPGDEVIPLTPIRRSIAQNMVLSASTIPQAWSMVEADVTPLEQLVSARAAEFKGREGVSLTFLPFAIKAAVEALKAVPRMNASWGEASIVQHGRIHIGIAVATEAGLLVPVIHDADRLSISGLARAIADLALRARSGQLKLEDIQGGTFTVDNTGAVGTELSVPIIVPGQAGIVTTERAKKKPVVVGDAIAIRTIMALCLSMDHRIVDGADAGRFLGEMRKRLESFDVNAALY